MPDLALSVNPIASAAVALRGINTSARSGGSGPAPGYSPPPGPPPPPTPVDATGSSWFHDPGAMLLWFIVDHEVFLTGEPTGMTISGTGIKVGTGLKDPTLTNQAALVLIGGGLSGTKTLTIPANDPMFRTATGGYLVAGDFEVYLG